MCQIRSFNKSEIDVSDFLPEGKDKRVVPKDKDFDFEFRRMLAKKQKKSQNLKKVLQKKQKRKGKKNLTINRLKM